MYNSNIVRQIKSNELLHKLEKNGDTALKYSGASYVPIFGSFGEQERSYMIFNITLDDAKIIARSYGQLSFFFGIVGKDTSGIAYYETKDCCKTYRLVEITETVTDESEAEDFFSKFGIKYKINMRIFGDDVPEVSNNGDFEESFKSETFSGRAIYRRNSYNYKNK